MLNESYSLQIISQHPEFRGRSLKKYSVNGLETIGVWGNEPFEIVFKNNTWNKIQVKLSIDGTDILTGKPADTEASGDMWSVSGYGTLTLKAWPESNKGGAQFIFTSAEKSVAVNTHGDLSSRGVIAAAVYVEGYQRLTRLNSDYDIYKSSSMRRASFGSGSSSGGWGGTLGGSSDISFNSMDSTLGYDVSASDESVSASCALNFEASVSLKSLAAVGAGQHVEQTITTVAGLIKPVLSTVARVRYMWWSELCEELKIQTVNMAGSGFPGERKMIDLSGVPRVGAVSPPQPNYTRF